MRAGPDLRVLPHADLPPGVRDPRLVPVWRSGRSALYAVRGGATT